MTRSASGGSRCQGLGKVLKSLRNLGLPWDYVFFSWRQFLVVVASCLAIVANLKFFFFLTGSEKKGGLALPLFFHSASAFVLLCQHVQLRAYSYHFHRNVPYIKLFLKTVIPLGFTIFANEVIGIIERSRIFREPHGGYVERNHWIVVKMIELKQLLEGYIVVSILLVVLCICEYFVLRCRGRDFGTEAEGEASAPRRRNTIRRGPHNKVYDEVVDADAPSASKETELSVFFEKGSGAKSSASEKYTDRTKQEESNICEEEYDSSHVSLPVWFARMSSRMSKLIFWLLRLHHLAVWAFVTVGIATLFLWFVTAHAKDWKKEPLCSNVIDGNPHCMLPFPSMHLLKKSESSKTGFHFDFRDELGIWTRTQKWMSIDNVRDFDGFSPMTSIAFSMQEADVDEYPGNYYHSTEGVDIESRTTVLIDTSTNKTHPHFVYKKGKLVFMQPVTAMKFNTRYVVGVQALKDYNGQPIPLQKDLSPEIVGEKTLETLAKLGWDQERIQLCFDFHTASEDAVLLQAMQVKEDAEARAQKGLKHKVIQVIDEKEKCTEGSNSNRNAYVVHAKFKGPDYSRYASDKFRLPGNTHGEEVLWTWAEYTVRIPCSVALNEGNYSLLHYGHGFLGDRREVMGNYLGELANKHRWILISLDTLGLTRHDLILILQLCVNQASLAEKIPNMILQSHINRILAEQVLQRELLRALKPIRDVFEKGNLNAVGYYGNSLGGIVGHGFVSMSDKVHRAVYGVSGTPYSLVTRFSDQFAEFRSLMKVQALYGEDIDVIVMITQSFWDAVESSGWIHCYQSSRSEGTSFGCEKVAPKSHFLGKNFLLQNGVVDISVPPIASHLIGSSVNALNVMPVRNIPILKNATSKSLGEQGSFLVEWLPERNLHKCLRVQTKAKEQVGHFMETGLVLEDCIDSCIANVTIGLCEEDI